jgi:hypothetical protein
MPVPDALVERHLQESLQESYVAKAFSESSVFCVDKVYVFVPPRVDSVEVAVYEGSVMRVFWRSGSRKLRLAVGVAEGNS